MKTRFYNRMKRIVGLALVLVIALGYMFSGLVFNINKVYAAEISYLITTTGSSCGLGTDEETLGAQGASNSTKVLTITGHSWNKTETERSILSGDWTVYVDITHNGAGGNRAITILLRRMNSSCVAQETILSGSVTPTKGATGEYSYTAVGVSQINFAANDILLLELDPATDSVHTLNYNGSGASYDSRMSSPDESAFALGITGPTTDVILTSIKPSETGETTFDTDELIVVTDGGGGWSLTVIMTVTLNDGGSNTIPDANVKLRTDGIPSGGDGTGDTYTIWSGLINLTDETTSGIWPLDTTKAIGTRSVGGTGGDVTNIRPTIQVVADLDQTPADYDGTMQFTVA